MSHIKTAVQRTALGGFGALMVLVGLGFLSAAGFMLLQVEYGAQVGCLVLGSAYLGAGLIAIAMARSKPDPVQNTQDAQNPIIPLAAAFLDGLNEGIAAQKARAAAERTPQRVPAE